MLFRSQLLALYFNVLPLPKAVNLLKQGKLPSRAVSIIFDDGYADNYTNALPILQKYNLHATFFIASGYLDGGRMWNDTIIETIRVLEKPELDLEAIHLGKFDISTPDKKVLVVNEVLQKLKHLAPEVRQEYSDYIKEQAHAASEPLMMTTEQLKALHKSGMEIGGHTVTHPIMAKLTDDQVKNEILVNKNTLEQILETKLRCFAYPNGKYYLDFLPTQIELVKACGYELAVTTEWGVADRNTDLWQLPRFTPWDNSPLKFIARMAQMFLSAK